MDEFAFGEAEGEQEGPIGIDDELLFQDDAGAAGGVAVERGEGSDAGLDLVLVAFTVDGEDGAVIGEAILVHDGAFAEARDVLQAGQAAGGGEAERTPVGLMSEAFVGEELHAAVVHEHAEEGVGVLADVADEEPDAAAREAFDELGALGPTELVCFGDEADASVYDLGADEVFRPVDGLSDFRRGAGRFLRVGRLPRASRGDSE